MSVSAEGNELPQEIRRKLAEIKVELAEGDITEKGYKKKLSNLLDQLPDGFRYPSPRESVPVAASASHVDPKPAGTRTRRHARLTTEIREEAVREALASVNHDRLSNLVPDRRRTTNAPEYYNSDSDDDTQPERPSVEASTSQPEVAPSNPLHPSQPISHDSAQPVPLPRTSLAETEPLSAAPHNGSGSGGSLSQLSQFTAFNGSEDSHGARRRDTFICQERVSEKIRKLVRTLKRPKRGQLQDYFRDEQDQLVARPAADPSAPRPVGQPVRLVHGDELRLPSGLPINLECALHQYANVADKTPAITCLGLKGTPLDSITFSKLSQRAMRVAYTLLAKMGQYGNMRPRQRVALVYANNEPIAFAALFYGCIMASVVPLVIELPSLRRDASCQSMGFLLSSQEIRLVLTSEQCYKGLRRTASGEIYNFPGWPKVHWINMDQFVHGVKVPKDWAPPDRLNSEENIYMEYSYAKDGSVRGVMNSRRAVLEHCRALTVACNYSEADVMVCVVDCRREVGLWHALLTSVYNGIHVIVVPYAVMQCDPGSWLTMVTKYRATVAIVRSRDMHWGMIAENSQSKFNLSSLRMLLVTDGANPWSLNTCEAFQERFQPYGLREDVFCPTAGSVETMTVCLRRPLTLSASLSRSSAGVPGANPPAKGILSMLSLSHGVIKVTDASDLTAITLQDCGRVLPGTTLAVVRLGERPFLCRTDEVGEICVSNDFCGSGFWGLEGGTRATFMVEPLNEANGQPVEPGRLFTRTGLLGFPGPANCGGLIFICGNLHGMMQVMGRRHNADDIIATVFAIPARLIFRSRIAVFSVSLLLDERVVIVAELRNDCSDSDAFTWMSQVIQTLEHLHQLSVYCIALVPQDTLPKTPFGGIHVQEVRRLLNEGNLHPTVMLLCPHSAIQNLPTPRAPISTEVGPSAMMVGQVVQGNRLAEAQGRLLMNQNSDMRLLPSILNWRAEHTPSDVLFTVYNQKGQVASRLTAAQLMNRVEKLKTLLVKAGADPGTVVGLMYPPGVELVCAFYACLFVGAIPVPIRPPQNDTHTGASSGSFGASGGGAGGGGAAGSSGGGSAFRPFGFRRRASEAGILASGTMHSDGGSSNSLSTSSGNLSNYGLSHCAPTKFTLEASLDTAFQIALHSNAACILTTASVIKLLKSKAANAHLQFSRWPQLLDSEDWNKKKVVSNVSLSGIHNSIAYLDFNVSTTGTLTGVPVTHAQASSLCQAQKLQCEFYPSMKVLLSLDPYSGLGFSLMVLTSVYCGHHSILVPPQVAEAAPDLWLSVANQEEIRDAFVCYTVIESSVRKLATQITQLKQRQLTLSNLRSLIVIAEERPRMLLTSAFIKLFSNLGLNSRAVSTSFGCRANLAICLQGSTSPDLTTVYVDKVSLRYDRIKVVEKGSPNSVCLLESGKLLPGVRVAIANPDTLGHCSDSQLGEIWISCEHNTTKLLGPFQTSNYVACGAATESSTASSLDELSTGPGDWSVSASRGDLAPAAGLPKSGVGLTGCGSPAQLTARLATGDTQRTWVRSGFLGFVRRTDMTQSDGHRHDALFVVGNLEEAVCLRGMRYHPIDIETSVLRAHRKICESVVFTWSNLLVVVVELLGQDSEAMDLVHPVTARVAEDHQLIVGVVVVVDPGTIPITPQGEKQRILLRDNFVTDRLQPIYISYNL